MIRIVWVRILCCLALAAVFAGGPAWAGGIMLYQFGSPDVGLAAAGYAARAQDAATVFTNPPGWAASRSPRSWAACRPCTAM